MLLRVTIALLAAAASLAAQDTTKSTAAPAAERAATGSYTEGQAALGKTAYETFCSPCHETSYHTDEQFRFNWFGRTAYDLFKTLKTTMPDDNPGSLTDEQYTRVITYIFKLNGFAAGTDSLASDSLSLKRVRIRAQVDTTKAPPPGR